MGSIHCLGGDRLWNMRLKVFEPQEHLRVLMTVDSKLPSVGEWERLDLLTKVVTVVFFRAVFIYILGVNLSVLVSLACSAAVLLVMVLCTVLRLGVVCRRANFLDAFFCCSPDFFRRVNHTFLSFISPDVKDVGFLP